MIGTLNTGAWKRKGWLAAIFATAFMTAPANAAFHQWSLTELYSNASGTLQFIEMQTPAGPGGDNQQFLSGQHITVANVGNTLSNTYNVTTNSGSPTGGHFLLFGTAGLAAAGGPAPDYIIPNGFLFTAGGSVSYFGNGGSYTPLAYTALPTDGFLSRTWAGGNALNSPTNFAGQSSPVPEPTTLVLAPLAFGAMHLVRRRRSNAAAL